MNINVILHIQLTEVFVGKVHIVPVGCTANTYIGCRNYSNSSILNYHESFSTNHGGYFLADWSRDKHVTLQGF